MSWLEYRILTGNLIFVVPTMTLFQNFEKLEILLSTNIVNLGSHDGTIMRTQVSQNLEKASWLVLKKSNYHRKSDFPTMTFCQKNCHGCVITMTFPRSTMTFSNYQRKYNFPTMKLS